MVDHDSFEESLCLSLQKLIGSELEMCWSMVATTLGGTKSETSVMWARSCPLFPEINNCSLDLDLPGGCFSPINNCRNVDTGIFLNTERKEKKWTPLFLGKLQFFLSDEWWMYRCTLGTSLGSFSDQKKCNDLCPRDKPNEKTDVYDCPDILAILSWNMGRPAQLQPEKRSPQGRQLLFFHTKRLEIRGSRQIFCPTLAFARFFSGSRAQLWERSMAVVVFPS